MGGGHLSCAGDPGKMRDRIRIIHSVGYGGPDDMNPFARRGRGTVKHDLILRPQRIGRKVENAVGF